jgi:hypothetical protein
MKTRVLVGLVLVSSLLAFPASAVASAPSSGMLVLAPAKGLGPSRGGPGLPYGYKALHPGAYALAKAFADARAGVNAYKTRGGGGGSGGGGPTVCSSTVCTNVSPSFNGIYQGGLTPPDTTGTIGPDRYIEIINDEYAIYSRTGSLINSSTLSALTGISGGLFGYSLSDPQMMWDPQTKRFYYSAVYYDAFLSDNGLAVGWSTTSTPKSSADFCQYEISFGSELPDYPKLGQSGDFLIYGYNKFNYGSSYDGSEFAVLNKPPSGPSCAPTSDFLVNTSGNLRNAGGTAAATPVPARLVDDASGSTGYVVANADLTSVPAAQFISVYSVSDGGTSNGIPVPNVVTTPTTITVASYSVPPSAPQKGSGYTLDTLDGRFEAAVAAVDPTYGKVAIWTAHAVAGGGGSEERWYEIDPSGTGSLLQHGSVTNASLFVWNGAISPDRANNGTTASFGGDWAMSVSTSSSSSYPAIQFVSTNHPGLTDLVQSSGPNVDFSCSPTCRWGDYSGATPDPAAPLTGAEGKVWLANQYNVAGGTTSTTAWRTWLFGVTP